MKKRTIIYINGIKASMYDISMLLERRDQIISIKRLENGNLSIKTA